MTIEDNFINKTKTKIRKTTHLPQSLILQLAEVSL